MARMNRNSCSILIVDSDESSVKRLAKTLKHLGHSVLVTADATHAVSILEFRAFGVLILDVETAVQKGIDLVGYAGCINPKPRIVAMDKEVTSETERELVDRGASLILRKPVNLRTLLDFLEPTRIRSSFSGKVEEIDILEYVQFILLGGRKTVLEITSTLGTKGRIYLADGNIIHAECGVLEGEKALYRCLCFMEGAFSHVPWEQPEEATINRPGEFLLMEAVRKRDEAWYQQGEADEKT